MQEVRRAQGVHEVCRCRVEHERLGIARHLYPLPLLEAHRRLAREVPVVRVVDEDSVVLVVLDERPDRTRRVDRLVYGNGPVV